MEQIISMSDLHAPFQDNNAFELAIKFARDLKPHALIIHEFCDWYSISKFNKDPDRCENLQDDLDVAVRLLEKLRKNFPKTSITMLSSNHDKRLKRYLWTDAKGLNSLRDLTVPAQLHLNDLDIAYKEYVFFRKTVLFKHGDVIRQHSAYTARAELDKEGISGCSGHTHRLGIHHRSDRTGDTVWVENGCLCTLTPEWVKGPANWQNGLGVFTFKDGKKHFHPGYVQIINGEILYGDKLYKL